MLHRDPGASADMFQQSILSGCNAVMMDDSLLADQKTPASYDCKVETTRGDTKETCSVPVEQIQRGIQNGVRGINIDTDIRLAMAGAMREKFAQDWAEFDPRKALKAATGSRRDICKARFIAFGCAVQASRIRPLQLDKMVVRYQ